MVVFRERRNLPLALKTPCPRYLYTPHPPHLRRGVTGNPWPFSYPPTSGGLFLFFVDISEAAAERKSAEVVRENLFQQLGSYVL